MSLVLKVIYETDSEPRNTPWKHYDSIDQKVVDFFEGMGMKWLGADFNWEDLTRVQEFEFDKDLNDEILTFAAGVEENEALSGLDLAFTPSYSSVAVLETVQPAEV